MSKGLGILLAVFGLISLVLPFFGLQFRLLNIFGQAQIFIAILLILVGGGIFFFSKQ